MVGITNNRGNTGVILLVAVLSACMLFYLIQSITPLLQYRRLSSQTNFRNNLSLAISNIKTTLNNSDALKNTLNHPDNASSLSCIKSGSCTQTSPTTLKVISIDKIVLSNGETVGITGHGEVCETQDNPNCMFIMKISWVPLCPNNALPCIDPIVEFSSEIKFNSLAKAFPFKLNELNFRFRKSGVAALIK